MGFPGFRFYPTEEELVGFYLNKRAKGGHPLSLDIIMPTLDLYQYDPWELPGTLKFFLLLLWLEFNTDFSTNKDFSTNIEVFVFLQVWLTMLGRNNGSSSFQEIIRSHTLGRTDWRFRVTGRLPVQIEQFVTSCFSASVWRKFWCFIKEKPRLGKERTGSWTSTGCQISDRLRTRWSIFLS